MRGGFIFRSLSKQSVSVYEKYLHARLLSPARKLVALKEGIVEAINEHKIQQKAIMTLAEKCNKGKQRE